MFILHSEIWIFTNYPCLGWKDLPIKSRRSLALPNNDTKKDILTVCFKISLNALVCHNIIWIGDSVQMRSSNTCSPFQIYKRQNTVDKVITCNSYKKWTGRVKAPIDVKIFTLYLLAARFWLGSDNISVLSMSGHQFCSAQSSIVQTFGESHGSVRCQFIQQNGLLSVMRGFTLFWQ